MNSITFYDVLGVDDHATGEEIKRAYRQASLKFHPDRGDGNARQFHAISTAYQVLSDPDQRASYDRGLTRPTPAGPPPAPEPEAAPWGSDDEWTADTDWGVETSWTPEPAPAPVPGGPPSNQQDMRRQTAAWRRVQRIGRRRSHDKTMVISALALCVTLLVPWLLGHELLRDTLLHPRSSAVYNETLRSWLRYFLPDWSAGCACLVGFAAVFLLFRPWSGRVAPVLVGWVLVGLVVVVLLPYTAAAWLRQEAITASQLRNTVYPLNGSWQGCGQASVSFGASTVESGRPAVTYTLYTTQRRNGNIGCSDLELWQGWQRIKQVPLPGAGKQAQAVTVTVNNTHQPKTTVFTVKLVSGKTVNYSLPQLLAR